MITHDHPHSSCKGFSATAFLPVRIPDIHVVRIKSSKRKKKPNNNTQNQTKNKPTKNSQIVVYKLCPRITKWKLLLLNFLLWGCSDRHKCQGELWGFVCLFLTESVIDLLPKYEYFRNLFTIFFLNFTTRILNIRKLERLYNDGQVFSAVLSPQAHSSACPSSNLLFVINSSFKICFHVSCRQPHSSLGPTTCLPLTGDRYLFIVRLLFYF